MRCPGPCKTSLVGFALVAAAAALADLGEHLQAPQGSQTSASARRWLASPS